MAEPFQKKAAEYHKLATEQLAQIPVVSERAALEALQLPEAEPAKVVKIDNPTPAVAVAEVPEMPYKQALGVLHSNPTSVTALNEIKGFYEAQGKERLASYFQGRLLQLNSGKGEKQ
jgi:hypothetical protein